MTLTERKRAKRPEHYFAKAARTIIYRELFGKSGEERGKQSNDPALDETRRLPSHWTYQGAVRVFNANIEAAKFSPQRKLVLERRLDSLRHHKAQSAEDKARSQQIDAIVATL